MTFRITNNLVTSIVMNNLNRNLASLMDIQSKLSSGKKLMKPSDDPVSTASAIRLRSRLSETTQLLRNIDQGETQMDLSDSSFEDISDLLMRAQDLAIGQANITGDANTRSAVAKEIEGIINQMVDILNKRVGNRYIFAGHETLDQPYLQGDNGIAYVGDSGQMNIEIESGATIVPNIPGSLLLPTAVDDLGGHANLRPYTERIVPLGQRKLVEINQGTGVDKGFIQITNSSGQVARIDLREARNLDEVAFRITSAIDETGRSLHIVASLDEGTGGLIIEDQTSPNDRKPGTHLKIENLGKTNVALQLGIKQEDLADTGRIVGRNLVPLELSTRLADLNRGSGVELGKFRITDRAGNSRVIDVGQAETLADVRKLINQAGLNLRADVNTGGNGLIITDASGIGATGTIKITEEGINTHTARDLGILTDETGVSSNVLIGQPLDPYLTENTPISLLNRGQGFELGSIQVKNGPKEGTIDLSSAATVGDIIRLINEAKLDLKAGINEVGTGISITSTVGGRTLQVANAQGSLTALLLGIEGVRDVLVDPVNPLGADSDLLIAIDSETRLKDLNDGLGVRNGTIRITDALGNAVNIAIKGVNTIQGVLNLINSYGPQGSGVINLVASLSPDQKGITLIDQSIPNSVIQTIAETGNLKASINELTPGQNAVVNAFRLADGTLVARNMDLVSQRLSDETTITGSIESVDKDNNLLSVRTLDGELYDVISLQPTQNLFVGQMVSLNGQTLLSGDFQARTADVITPPQSGDEQLVVEIVNVDTVNKKVTLRTQDDELHEVRLITERGLIKVEDISGGTAASDLGIRGASVVGSDRIVGDALNAVMSETTQVSLLQGGTMIMGKIQISNGNNDVVIDLSNTRTIADVLTLINTSTVGVVASINESGKGISLRSRINGTTLMVNKIALQNPDGTNKKNSDGSTIFDDTANKLGLTGSSDVMGNLLFLRNALLNNNQADVARTLDNFTIGLNRVLSQRTVVGALVNQMTTTRDRSLDAKLQNTETLSSIEDLDVIEAVSDLASKENAFNAALKAASEIILPSLLDFL